jgi:hypothetical protein
MATLKKRGGGPFGWLKTQLGLDSGDANLRASSGTRRRRQKAIERLYNFSTRPRSRSSRSGSGTRKSKSK